MSRTERSYTIPMLVAAASFMLIGCVLMAEGPSALLAALPALFLFGALACRRYPGEKLLERLGRRRPRRRPRAAKMDSAPPRATRVLGRTLLFLATVRSLRGPPVPSSLSI